MTGIGSGGGIVCTGVANGVCTDLPTQLFSSNSHTPSDCSENDNDTESENETRVSRPEPMHPALFFGPMLIPNNTTAGSDSGSDGGEVGHAGIKKQQVIEVGGLDLLVPLDNYELHNLFLFYCRVTTWQYRAEFADFDTGVYLPLSALVHFTEQEWSDAAMDIIQEFLLPEATRPILNIMLDTSTTIDFSANMFDEIYEIARSLVIQEQCPKTLEALLNLKEPVQVLPKNGMSCFIFLINEESKSVIQCSWK